jgi:hypothetical protein
MRKPNAKQGIGRVPVANPNAREQIEDEFIPFRVDRNDPDQQRLAELLGGWEKLEAIQEAEEQAGNDDV